MEEVNPISRKNHTGDAVARLFSYRDKPLSAEIMEAITSKRTIKNPRIYPYINIDDLNNKNDDDDNRPKRALVFGLKGEF